MLWGGGLLSLLKLQNTGYYFDVSDIYNPAYKKSDIATLSSIADEVRAKPEGGFFFTYMGSAAGTDVGRLVETDAEYNIIHQWPEDVPGVLNVLDQQFDPHGLSIDWDKNLILTSDFLSPISILKPSTTIQRANTLRLWDLTSRTILNTITIPDVSRPAYPIQVFERTSKLTIIREAEFKTSSSFPEIPTPLRWQQPCTLVKSGSYTPSRRTPRVTKGPRSCTMI